MTDNPIEQQLRKELADVLQPYIDMLIRVAENTMNGVVKVESPPNGMALLDAVAALFDTYAARRADEARQTELYAVNKVNNAIYSDDPAAYYVNIQRHVNNRLAELSHKEAKG